MIPLSDSVPARRAPVVTWALIALNIGVFLGELFMGPAEAERFFYLFGVVPARFTHPDWAYWVGFPVESWWPLLTSMFLHAGWLHLVGNMWTLWIFGDNVEERMGPVRYLLFYLSCGVAAGLVHWFSNADSTVPMVGASGAIAGVLGAYLYLFPRARIVVMVPLLFWPLFFELPAVAYLLFWLVTQLLGGAIAGLGPEQVAGVAWWAHVGGFATGVLLHRAFMLPQRQRPRRLFPDEYGFDTVSR